VGTAHADEPEWSQLPKPTLGVRVTHGVKMNKVKVHIMIDREAAILSGHKHYGLTVFEVDPAELTLTQRSTLASLLPEKNECSDITKVCYKPCSSKNRSEVTACLPKVDEGTHENIKILLDAYPIVLEALIKNEEVEAELVKQNAEKASAEIKEKEILVKEWERQIENKLTLQYLNSDVKDLVGKSPPSQTAYCSIDRREHYIFLPLSDARVKERIDEVQALSEAAKLKAEASLMRKQLQQASWIEANGTDSQRKRFARGLLPETEILRGMRDTVFSFLNEFENFLKITEAEVNRYENDDDDTDPRYWDACQFESKAATKATDDEYKKLEIVELKARAEYPDAKVSLIVNNGGLETNNHWTITRSSILVELKVGEIKFSRHYACP